MASHRHRRTTQPRRCLRNQHLRNRLARTTKLHERRIHVITLNSRHASIVANAATRSQPPNQGRSLSPKQGRSSDEAPGRRHQSALTRAAGPASPRHDPTLTEDPHCPALRSDGYLTRLTRAPRSRRMTNIRTNKHLNDLAAVAVLEAASHGWILDPEGAVDMIATRVEDIAAHTGDTARYTLEQYVTANNVRTLIQNSLDSAIEAGFVIDDTRTVSVDVRQAARLIGHLAQVARLVTTEDTDMCNGTLHNIVADAVLNIATTIGDQEHPHLSIDYQAAALTRTALTCCLDGINNDGWRFDLDGPADILDGITGAFAEVVDEDLASLNAAMEAASA